MVTILEGQLQFEFPDSWKVSRFDQWSFYRKQFMKLSGARSICSFCENSLSCPECGKKNVAGTKGVDILALDENSTCWCVEIKDYRLTRISDFGFLADEIALKVRDSLACLVAAKSNASNLEEKQLASDSLSCQRFRIVLHLEQPHPHSRLSLKESRRANIKQQLKRLVKSIDPRPLVLEMSDLKKVCWNVRQLGAPIV